MPGEPTDHMSYPEELLLWGNSTSNQSTSQCAALNSSWCIINGETMGRFGAIAGLRMVISLLSLLGALSIIVSALLKRQVKSAKVHPIFVLSIADTLLAVLWVVGGAMWVFRDYIQFRVICLPISLLTMILECVTINLTLVYAIIAHAHIKQADFSSILTRFSRSADLGWPWTKVLAVYFSAWLFPALLVGIPFMFIASLTDLVRNANHCSCWCAPLFANILPIVWPKDDESKAYMLNIKKVGVAYSTVLLCHYLVVFPLLVVCYGSILNHIRTMRKLQSQQGSNYGATKSLVKGHSQAKARVLLFLLVFIATGLCNLILAFVLLVHLSDQLQSGKKSLDHHPPSNYLMPVIIILIVQSVTVPLQGFLNAIVYGWTREEFLYVMVSTSKREKGQVNSVYIQKDGVSSDVEESSFYDSSYQNWSRQQTPEYLSGD